MRFSKRTLIAASATMAMLASAGPAMAHINVSTMNMDVPESQSYAGSWPVTVSHSQRSNGTGCLTLTGAGNVGSASLVFGGQTYHYGSFLVINHILMATLQEPLYGQNGALTFTASARRGHIDKGLFENIEGGSNFDFGALAFGMKGGC
jgi:Tfp pilus tip-associated adhesin PilY1